METETETMLKNNKENEKSYILRTTCTSSRANIPRCKNHYYEKINKLTNAQN